MTTALGAILFAFAAVIWGFERSRYEQEKIDILEGIISFVSYTEEQITSFKTPLARIYTEFSDSVLESTGFIDALKSDGAERAVELLKGRISEDAYRDALFFAKGLGGGYSDGQKKLCDIAQKRLEKALKDGKTALSERTRMYRLLPILIAASVIILLI